MPRQKLDPCEIIDLCQRYLPTEPPEYTLYRSQCKYRATCHPKFDCQASSC